MTQQRRHFRKSIKGNRFIAGRRWKPFQMNRSYTPKSFSDYIVEIQHLRKELDKTKKQKNNYKRLYESVLKDVEEGNY